MKPILFNSTDTTFSTNGIGALSDAISCRVGQTLNGQYELELKYPITGLHFSSIQQRSIIQAKVDPVSKPQPFRVYQVTKPSSGVVTVRARHLSYDLGGIPVSPFDSQDITSALSGLSSNAVVDCPFVFTTDKDASATFSVAVPSLIWSLLGESKGGILETFGGEYEFDVYDVILWNRRGADRGVSIRYGKNLTSLEQDENCANCYTGVYPYWIKTDGQLVQLPEKIVNVPGAFNYEKVMPVDFSTEWQEVPTQEQLRARTEEYIANNDIGKPAVSWKVEFVQLEQTAEYKGTGLLERVFIGDTVSVEFEQMGVSASARVVQVDYDTLLERYNSVILGSVKANLASTIAAQNKEISARPQKSEMQAAVERFVGTGISTNGLFIRSDEPGSGALVCATVEKTDGKNYGRIDVKSADGHMVAAFTENADQNGGIWTVMNMDNSLTAIMQVTEESAGFSLLCKGETVAYLTATNEGVSTLKTTHVICDTVNGTQIT